MANRKPESAHKPFLLKPVGKDYLWGGRRLKENFSKQINMDPLAESWECSTHPDGISSVASGEHKGMLLTEVLSQHPEYLGEYASPGGELPFLIKFIDAAKALSVQVHPNDEFAQKYEKQPHGKNEMWYILDASEDASLIYGLNQDMKKEDLRKSIEDGTVEQYLRKVPVKKKDVFYVEAGQIHAIGAGVLLVEVQENSNLTYRMFDYGRVDKNGHKRQLHIEKAVEAANLKKSPVLKRQTVLLEHTNGHTRELLCDCGKFCVERWELREKHGEELLLFQTAYHPFQVFLCIEGSGEFSMGQKERLSFAAGDCIFVPANSVSVKLEGETKFMRIMQRHTTGQCQG